MNLLVLIIIILVLYFLFVWLPTQRNNLIRQYKNVIELCDYYDQWFQSKEKKDWAFKRAKEIITPLIGQQQLAHISSINDFNISKIMKAFRKEANEQIQKLKYD